VKSLNNFSLLFQDQSDPLLCFFFTPLLDLFVSETNLPKKTHWEYNEPEYVTDHKCETSDNWHSEDSETKEHEAETTSKLVADLNHVKREKEQAEERPDDENEQIPSKHFEKLTAFVQPLLPELAVPTVCWIEHVEMVRIARCIAQTPPTKLVATHNAGHVVATLILLNLRSADRAKLDVACLLCPSF
jgi:hypothetical protein